ncbi:MAG: metallophosphoesterase [Thermicanus sp.]|nr:metallophosphoesterase [Thermicanus sp.]
MWVIGISLVLFLLFFRKAYRNTFDVSIQRIEVPVKLPRGEELRILQLSDMHLERLSITPEHLYSLIQGEEVDLIALTGDQIEQKRNIEPFMEYIRILKKINPRLGIYVIFGNHDYLMRKENLLLFRRRLEEEGCVVMQNENLTLPFGGTNLNIIGIDDYSTRRSDIRKSYQGTHPDGINLILTHDPNLVLQMKEAPFDYLISGHFHGGQIHWPKPYHLAKMGKLARMNIVKGLHYMDDSPFYISEGLGQTGINIRTGSRPEITIHILRGTGIAEEKMAEAI